MSSSEPPRSLEKERQLQNPDGSVRDKTLVEIKREMLLAEASGAEECKRRRHKRKREKHGRHEGMRIVDDDIGMARLGGGHGCPSLA